MSTCWMWPVSAARASGSCNQRVRRPAGITVGQQSLRHYGDRVHAQVLDVRDETAVTEYMQYVADRGRVDYLFCNAGVGFGQPYSEVTRREDWNTIFDVNVFGVVNCVHPILPRLIKQGSGHIIIVSSVAGISPLPYQTGLRCLQARRVRVRAMPEAGTEILDAIRNGQDVIPVTQDARDLYQAIQKGDYDYVEDFMQAVKEQNEGVQEVARTIPGGGVPVRIAN